MYSVLRIVLGISGLALTGAAIFQIGVVAMAERAMAADTLPALEEATRFAPGDAELFARIAQLDPTRKDALDTALRLNAHEPSWWSMRAIDEERAGDLAAAESSLKRSVAAANYFVPNWSLAAFYYRHGNVPGFLSSAHTALAVRIFDDPGGIFRMAVNLKIPSDTIDSQILSDNPDTIASWLDFASGSADWSGAEKAAVRLLALAPRDYRNRILNLCNQLLAAGRVEEAVTLWNRLSRAHWIEMPPIDSSGLNIIVDGTFSLPRLDAGFDWRLVAPTNVTFTYPSSGIRLEFDGNEPEECELMSQFVPVTPGESYRLTTTYHTKGLPAASGVRWSAMEEKRVIETSQNLASGDTAKQTFEFRAQPEIKLARIVLRYQREPGTVRIAGQLWIDSVQLERIRPGVKP